jgi:hypothetical protein
MVHQKSRIWPKVQRFHRFLQGGMILFLTPLFGCGSTDGLNRQAISGSVTLDGQPISIGAILFEPATQESGTAVGATIRQGNFTISRRDGPVPGSYRVRVYASSGIQAPPAKGQTDHTPRPMVERIPARYNTETELLERVLSGHVNRYRLDLSSSGPPNLR